MAVCELGSIGRAAEREFIAASAVSKRLSDLEATLDTPLLYRHTRGVDLTPAGESLLHHARSVLYSLEKMQGELSEYADGVRGHVRVHANISAIVQFLPEDLGAFTRDHEAIKIDLEEHLSSEVLRAVQEGAADLGICHAGRRRAANCRACPTAHDRLVLIVPAGHALAAQRRHRLRRLAGLRPRRPAHQQLDLRGDAPGRAATPAARIKLRIHVTGLDAMCRMIDNGLGIGVMPRRAFELMHGGSAAAWSAWRCTDAWAQREIRLVARDFSTLPVAARTLVEHLQAAGAAAANRPSWPPEHKTITPHERRPTMARTLYDKIWDEHVVHTEEDGTVDPLHRPPPGARSHQPAGLRRPARGRPQAVAHQLGRGHGRPQHADHRLGARLRRHHRPDQQGADHHAGQQHRASSARPRSSRS